MANVFRRDDESIPYSFYQAEKLLDYKKIAIGLNSARQSLTEQIGFIYFFPEEIDLSGLQTTYAPGETRCQCANMLHRDICGTDAQFRKLCLHAINAKREPIRAKKSVLIDYQKQLAAGCTVFESQWEIAACKITD